MKYTIIYDENEIVSIQLNGGQILTLQSVLVDTLENAKVMLHAAGVDTKKIDDFVEDEI